MDYYVKLNSKADLLYNFFDWRSSSMPNAYFKVETPKNVFPPKIPEKFIFQNIAQNNKKELMMWLKYIF